MQNFNSGGTFCSQLWNWHIITYHVLFLVDQPNVRHPASQPQPNREWMQWTSPRKWTTRHHHGTGLNQRNRTYVMSPLSSVPSPLTSSLSPERLEFWGRGRLAPAGGREPPALLTTTSLPLLQLLVPTTKPPGCRFSITSPALLLRNLQHETVEHALSSRITTLELGFSDAPGARMRLAPSAAMSAPIPKLQCDVQTLVNLCRFAPIPRQVVLGLW